MRRPRTFVQLPVSALGDAPGLDYRSGFRAWAEHHGDPRSDRVLVYTLDEDEAKALRAHWSGWRHAEVLLATGCWDPACPGSTTAFRTPTGTPAGAGTDPALIRRLDPSGEPIAFGVPCDRLGIASERSGSSESPEVHVCLDLRVPDQRAMPLPKDVAAVCAVIADVPPAWLRPWLTARRGEGLRPSGRPFGEAGTSMAFLRITGPRTLLTAAARESRVRSGALLERGLRWSARAKADLAGRARGSERSLETAPTATRAPVSKAEIARIIERVESQPDGSWNVPVDEPDPDAVARDCHERLGVFPISFSYPAALPLQVPSQQLSAITPGLPYSFTDNAAYLAAYASAAMGLTFRKAGWDCFRHVEIMAAGAVPLMPDASEIPPFAMIHYPRRAMAAVADRAISVGGRPDDATRASFRRHFERHLTTRAMAEYVLRMSGLEGVRTILFVDAETPVNPEYQSTLALIGLKELLGTGCEVAFPASFLYRDSSVPSIGFYGRGFGYTHAIDPLNRTASEERDATGHGLDRLDDYDAVVLGSVSRNVDISRQVLRSCDPRRVIVIHGEDGPPTPTDVRELRGSGASVFVRAIHAGPAA